MATSNARNFSSASVENSVVQKWFNTTYTTPPTGPPIMANMIKHGEEPIKYSCGKKYKKETGGEHDSGECVPHPKQLWQGI